MARQKRSRVAAKASTVAPHIELQDADNQSSRRRWHELSQFLQRSLQLAKEQLGRGFTALLVAVRQHATHVRPGPEALRVSQRVSLGEKRYVAVLQCGGERFLVGGGAGSVAMLARLKSEESDKHSFAEVLHRVDTERMTIQ